MTNERVKAHCGPEADGSGPNKNGKYGKRLITSPNGGFNVLLKDIHSIPRPHPLRRDLTNGMVKNWSSNLNDPEVEQAVYEAYFHTCAPSDCYYDKPQQVEPATVITILLGILGGLAALLKGAINGAVNAVTGVVFGVKRLDIVQLNDQHDEEMKLAAEKGNKEEGEELGKDAAGDEDKVSTWATKPTPSNRLEPVKQVPPPVQQQQQQQQQMQAAVLVPVQQVAMVPQPFIIAPDRIREI